jgi:hypothetical protein
LLRESFANGEVVPQHATNLLQDRYLDAQAVAEQLGLERITVTTRTSPRVPEPAVLLGGLQLWLVTDISRGSHRRQ